MAYKRPKREQEAEKTRNTKSYGMWEELGEAYDNGGMPKLLVAFFDELDGRCAYGSATNADSAWRALRQYLRDRGVPSEIIDRLRRRYS